MLRGLCQKYLSSLNSNQIFGTLRDKLKRQRKKNKTWSELKAERRPISQAMLAEKIYF